MKSNMISFNWVLKNEIAIGTGPETNLDITKLKKEGIKSILSLCDKKESCPPDLIYKNFKYERIILPDHTYDRNITLEEINLSIVKLAELKSLGPVFVHCKAAVERSPLICIAWLVKNKSLTIQQSLDYLMSVNKGTCPSKENLETLKLLV